jgi:hypothetical protein
MEKYLVRKSRVLRATPNPAALAESISPIGEVLRNLPKLRVDAQGELDLLGSSPAVLASLAENAEACAGALSLGLSAVGQLLAFAAPEVEDHTISSDSTAALGWLFAELGYAMAFFLELGVRCRQANSVGQQNA